VRCEQGRPLMARQEATILCLSATQNTSALFPDLHSEHFRTTKLVPFQTLKHALAHGGHHHAGKPFLQPAMPRVVTTGGGVKFMRCEYKHSVLVCLLSSLCTSYLPLSNSGIGSMCTPVCMSA